MKIQRIEAGEIWGNGKRLGLIVEDWFYPVSGAQLSAEELLQIAKAMKEEIFYRQSLGRLHRRPVIGDMTDHISEVLNQKEPL